MKSVLTILVALLLGAVLAIGLLQLETSNRAGRAAAERAPASSERRAADAAPKPAAAAAPAKATSANTAPATAPAPAAGSAKPASATAPAGAAGPTTAPSAPAAGAPAAADAAAGQKVYTAQCNGCHPNGGKGFGPALRGPEFTAKFADDASLSKIIREGKGSMPAYPAAKLNDGDLASLVAYIRSL